MSRTNKHDLFRVMNGIKISLNQAIEKKYPISQESQGSIRDAEREELKREPSVTLEYPILSGTINGGRSISRI